MIIPKFIKKGDCIGVTAPSDGIIDEVGLHRLDNAISNIKNYGYKVIETDNVRCSVFGRSSSSKERALELESLFKDKGVHLIVCASGGDFLLEMLSEFDFGVVRDNPKWLQGFSDPTGLLFTITTNLDIATIYGENFVNFGMESWHTSLENNLELLEGKRLGQDSFSKYESKRGEYITGLEGYHLDSDVLWENINCDNVCVSGRMIGGCIDILNDLFGTRFDKTVEFIDKYKNDGILWYFDNCEMSSEQLIRTLWKFKDNGWFKFCNGIIFGRSAREYSYYDISFKEAVKGSLEDLNIPIIINADIGHVSPRMTIINGALCEVTSKDGKGSIQFRLE